MKFVAGRQVVAVEFAAAFASGAARETDDFAAALALAPDCTEDRRVEEEVCSLALVVCCCRDSIRNFLSRQQRNQPNSTTKTKKHVFLKNLE